jgi:prepilin-type N-terminal cleavage/methylation domain-containing protein
MNHKKGFTLIELLVVIAIIGLLASIVVVNVNSARDKAKIARSVSFGQQVYNSLGSEAAVYWDFNNLVGGNTVKDISNNGNNGTCSGSNCPTLANSLIFSGGNFGNAFNFNGNDRDYMSSNPVLVPDNGTIVVWIKGDKNSQVLENIYPIGFAQVSLLGPSSQTDDRAGIIAGTLSDYDWISWGGQNIFDNNWHHYAVSWKKTGTATWNVNLYVDGLKIGDTKTSTKMPSGSLRQIVAGGAWSPGDYGSFTGFIDEFYIYNAALAQGEIQKHYTKGLLKHQFAKQ